MIKVRSRLMEDADLKSELSKNSGFSVYRDIAPEGEQMPFVVWGVVSSRALNNIDCAATEDAFSLRFDVYSSDQEECDRITKKLRLAVNSFARVQGYISAPTVDGECRNAFTATTIEEF